MGAGKRVRQFAERFGQGQLVQGEPRSECPEGGADYHGIQIRSTIDIDREGRWHLLITDRAEVQKIKDCFGNEHCLAVISVKGVNIYSVYNPLRGLYGPIVPSRLQQKGQGIEATVRELSRSEFLSSSTKTGKLPFELIIDRSGNSGLLVIEGNSIPVAWIDELRWNNGQVNAPALVFSIKDYQGKETFLKIAYNGHGDAFLGVKTPGFKRVQGVEYDPGKALLTITYLKETPYKRRNWLRAPPFEYYEHLKIGFFKMSLERVEGVIDRDSYAGINWYPYADFTKKGILGTEIECAVLKKSGVKDIAYDLSGGNDMNRGIRYFFDASYFDENRKFVVEEVKLRTSEKSYRDARYDAILEFPKRLKEWNAMSDDARKGLPRLYEGTIVIVLFNPQSGEFTRRLDGWIKIDKDTGIPRYFPNKGVA